VYYICQISYQVQWEEWIGISMARHRPKVSFISEETVDLTPLIDCVFMLLIFFMVTTVFIHARGLDVDLPRASQATEQQEKKDINIIIERDGRIEIGGVEVLAGELRARIERAMAENRNDNVIIQGDRGAAQSRVVEVVDAAKGAGVKGIAFAKLQGS
jgi:biopolymer transport protein ExbD